MLAIIGCGNLNRSDDGVGVVVARRVQERLARHPVPGVKVFDLGTGGMEVMFAARGCDALLILDACRTQGVPGAIYDVPGEELARDKDPTYSLHDFRWDHALSAGRRIFKADFPSDVKVLLVEAQSVELGLSLTPAVSQAAELLYARVLQHLAEHAQARHAREQAIEVTVNAGTILLSAPVYRAFFDGREGALVFEREGALCVMPVEAVAGGLLVKQKNLAGDRAIDAHEVLRAKGWGDGGTHTVTARWDGKLGALALSMPELPRT